MKNCWIALRIISTFMVLLCLLSCAHHPHYAPVSAASPSPSKRSASHTHRIRRGETLYSIAWRYGMDYRDLARINHMHSPYSLTIGRRLRLKAAPSRKRHPYTRHKKIARKRVKKRVKKRYSKRTKSAIVLSNKRRKGYKPIKYWRWPTHGKLIRRFGPRRGSKGVDIIGRRGQSIRTVAPGRVAYSGSGLRGYGRLLIIKHNNEFLSAYAHNDKLLVKEGDWIKAGQVIAKMGSSGAKRVMLHFELRKAGRPTNPLRYMRQG